MNQDYIYAKIQKMVTLNDSIYKNLARLLITTIEDTEFYNGTIELECEDHNYKLRCTLLIYREPLLDPTDRTECATRIQEIVPVWWECQSSDAWGAVLNDFSWSEFREFLL